MNQLGAEGRDLVKTLRQQQRERGKATKAKEVKEAKEEAA